MRNFIIIFYGLFFSSQSYCQIPSDNRIFLDFRIGMTLEQYNAHKTVLSKGNKIETKPDVNGFMYTMPLKSGSEAKFFVNPSFKVNKLHILTMMLIEPQKQGSTSGAIMIPNSTVEEIGKILESKYGISEKIAGLRDFDTNEIVLDGDIMTWDKGQIQVAFLRNERGNTNSNFSLNPEIFYSTSQSKIKVVNKKKSEKAKSDF